MQAKDYIGHLGLVPHPEGGYYKEIYRSKDQIAASELPRHNGTRNLGTSILFLLEEGQKSHFHRLKSDELWYYHDGGPCQIFIIHPDGSLETQLLGKDIRKGESLQVLLPAGTWFAATPAKHGDFSLFGCVVVPGFDFNDFELATATALTALFPDHAQVIKDFCIQ